MVDYWCYGVACSCLEILGVLQPPNVRSGVPDFRNSTRLAHSIIFVQDLDGALPGRAGWCCVLSRLAAVSVLFTPLTSSREDKIVRTKAYEAKARA